MHLYLKIYFVIFLVFPWSAFALYNGNPSAPQMPESGLFIDKDEWLGLKVGYLFDCVYDRSLRMVGQRLEHCSKKIQDYHSMSHFGVVTLNFIDRVELFGTLGINSFELVHRPFSGTKISYKNDSHFAWGVGGRALLAYWGNLQLGVNAAYMRSDPSLSTLKVNGRSHTTHHAHIDFSQWQIGSAVSYVLDWFIPYLGVDFSDYRMRIEHLRAIKDVVPNGHVTFKDTYPFGLYLGFGISADRAFSLNVEARVFNENAVSVSADFKF